MLLSVRFEVYLPSLYEKDRSRVVTATVPGTVRRTILNTVSRLSHALFPANYVWASFRNRMNCITDYSPHRTIRILGIDELYFLRYSSYLFSKHAETLYCTCLVRKFYSSTLKKNCLTRLWLLNGQTQERLERKFRGAVFCQEQHALWPPEAPSLDCPACVQISFSSLLIGAFELSTNLGRARQTDCV